MGFGILQVGRSLCLLGRFTTAEDVYKEALQLVQTDWELWHSQGLVYTSLKMYDRSVALIKGMVMAQHAHARNADSTRCSRCAAWLPIPQATLPAASMQHQGLALQHTWSAM